MREPASWWAACSRRVLAVGAFNVDNRGTLLAIVRAAQAQHAPVLIELSQAEGEALGLTNMGRWPTTTVAEYGVEMYIDLDQIPSVEGSKARIGARRGIWS